MTVTAADTETSFAEEVLAADQPVVVDFWAPWCGPCRMVGPEVEALAEEYRGRIKFVKTNVDEVPSVSHRYGIMGIPMIGLFREGELVKSITGARPRHAIVQDLGLAFYAPVAPPSAAAPPASPGDEAKPAAAPSDRPTGRY